MNVNTASFYLALVCPMIIYNSVKGAVYELVTNQTTVIGSKLFTVYKNIPYAAFFDIPYAEPPIGNLRFKSPKGPQTFLSKGDSNNFSKECNAKSDIELIEDRLLLSLYMPISNERATSFPVAVWVYENSHEHEPDFLIEENILVVIVSFRTSVLGFLNTDDDFAKGNMGAKDVLMSLKWIRSNIYLFNGDLNKVTVIGTGNGADIVAALLVSCAAEDLFTRVIVHGGSALSPIDYGNHNYKVINKLHWRLYGNSERMNRKKLYEYFSETPVNTLEAISHDLFDSTEIRDRQRRTRGFGCTVETDKKYSFIHEHPLQVYKRKLANYDVDVMFGYSNFDALFKLRYLINRRILLKYLNYNFQYLLPFFGNPDEFNSKRYKNIQRRIKSFYFINGTITERSFRRYVKYHTDQVIYPLVRQARLQCERSCSNVYLYRFIYNGCFNIKWSSLPKLHWSGATSGDEICYQFKCKSVTHEYSSAKALREKKYIKKMTRLLANFIKFGNPTPKSKDSTLKGLLWEPIRINQTIKVLSMGKTFKLMTLPEQERIDFWDKLKEDFFEEDA